MKVLSSLLLILSFSFSINAQYENFQFLPDNGTREIAYAASTFQEHMLKSMDYTVNVSTPGFIRKSLSNVRLYNSKEGRHVVVPVFSYKWIEGPPVQSDRMLDFCINGNNKSFFTVQLTNNMIGFTKDGRFRVDYEGRLVTLSGNFPVLGTTGFIRFNDTANIDVTVSRSGSVYNNNTLIGQMKITSFEYFQEMNDFLHNINGAFFILTKDIAVTNDPKAYGVLQGFYMQSNSYKSHDGKFYRAYHTMATQALYKLIESQKKVFSAMGS